MNLLLAFLLVQGGQAPTKLEISLPAKPGPIVAVTAAELARLRQAWAARKKPISS